MSENTCSVRIVGPTIDQVCQALLTLVGQGGPFDLKKGLLVEGRQPGERSLLVTARALAPVAGHARSSLFIDEWDAERLDLSALGRTLGCAMLCEHHFSRGIDHSRRWITHQGDEIYAEWEDADGIHMLRCPALGPTLAARSLNRLVIPRRQAMAKVREQLGDVATALLKR